VFVLIIWVVAFLILDWKKAIYMVIIPQQVSAFAVFVFNYVQHVHVDEESKYNHSRNFMGVNLFLFNNGYHTMHHEKAVLHWSELPEAHKKIEHLIAPHLTEQSFWWYMIRTYVLSIFMFQSTAPNLCALDRIRRGARTNPKQHLRSLNRLAGNSAPILFIHWPMPIMPSRVLTT
jgi:fatty acid desaturase